MDSGSSTTIRPLALRKNGLLFTEVKKQDSFFYACIGNESELAVNIDIIVFCDCEKGYSLSFIDYTLIVYVILFHSRKTFSIIINSFTICFLGWVVGYGEVSSEGPQ